MDFEDRGYNDHKSHMSPWERKDDVSIVRKPSKPANAKIEGKAIEFTVYHTPMGAPRMTQADRWRQRPCVMRYREFKDAIRRDAPELPNPEDINELSWVAYFVPPPSMPVQKRKAILGTLHRQKPDRDNIDKAVLDALFQDDQAIAHGTLTKRWGTEAKMVITVLPA